MYVTSPGTSIRVRDTIACLRSACEDSKHPCGTKATSSVIHISPNILALWVFYRFMVIYDNTLPISLPCPQILLSRIMFVLPFCLPLRLTHHLRPLLCITASSWTQNSSFCLLFTFASSTFCNRISASSHFLLTQTHPIQSRCVHSHTASVQQFTRTAWESTDLFGLLVSNGLDKGFCAHVVMWNSMVVEECDEGCSSFLLDKMPDTTQKASEPRPPKDLPSRKLPPPGVYHYLGFQNPLQYMFYLEAKHQDRILWTSLTLTAWIWIKSSSVAWVINWASFH